MQNNYPIKICTWNLWFSTFVQKNRIETAMSELQSQDHDIICLQEITNSIINTINQCPIINTHQLIYDAKNIISYGQVFLVKNSLCPHITIFQSISFPKSKMSRKICQLSLDTGITILNVHLESEFVDHPLESDTKFHQLKFLLQYAQNFDKVIICGDCNIGIPDELLFTSIINKNRFCEIGPKQNTYDYKRNSNIKDHFQSRLDRIFCNFPCQYQNNPLLGLTPLFVRLSNQVLKCYPSDHFGLNMVIFPN